MALLVCAGAESSVYEVSWGGVCVQSSTRARSGTYSFRLNGGYASGSGMNPNWIGLNFVAGSTIYFQVAIYVTEVFGGTTNNRVFIFRSGSVFQIVMSVTGNSTFKLWRGDCWSPGVEIASVSAGFALNSWNLFEGYLYVADSNGIIQIKKDGVMLFDFVGDTQYDTNTIDSFVVGVTSSGGTDYSWYDDLIINNNQGSYFNSWPGGVRIHALRPSGVGNYSQWTPAGTSPNWDCVDETPVSSAEYVHTGVAGQKDSYQMSNCPTGLHRVRAVVPQFWGEGGQAIKRLLRISSTDYLGATVNLTSSFGKVEEIHYVSPATSSAWTLSEVDGLESGMENV